MIPNDAALTLVYERDSDGWWTAYIPQVPGATSQGRTQAEAKDAALVAAALLMKARHDEISGDGRQAA